MAMHIHICHFIINSETCMYLPIRIQCCSYKYGCHSTNFSIVILILDAACPIKGQIRKKCASPPSCHKACNTTGPIFCPRICITNGCECPRGMIIDWTKNECVTPIQCLGMYIVISYMNL